MKRRSRFEWMEAHAYPIRLHVWKGSNHLLGEEGHFRDGMSWLKRVADCRGRAERKSLPVLMLLASGRREPRSCSSAENRRSLKRLALRSTLFAVSFRGEQESLWGVSSPTFDMHDHASVFIDTHRSSRKTDWWGPSVPTLHPQLNHCVASYFALGWPENFIRFFYESVYCVTNMLRIEVGTFIGWTYFVILNENKMKWNADDVMENSILVPWNFKYSPFNYLWFIMDRMFNNYSGY